MDDPVFKMKPVGRVGPYRVGPEYRMRIEERGKRLARAARPKKLIKAEARQLRLPFNNNRHAGLDPASSEEV